MEKSLFRRRGFKSKLDSRNNLTKASVKKYLLQTYIYDFIHLYNLHMAMRHFKIILGYLTKCLEIVAMTFTLKI